MLSTTVSFDFGVIVTAIAPSMLVGVTFWIARAQARVAKRDAAEAVAKIAADALARDQSAEKMRQRIFVDATHAANDTRSKLEGIHALVNDQLTREKQARLLELRTHAVIVAKMVGPDPDAAAIALIESLNVQANGLEAEIAKRDEAAATLTKEQAASSGDAEYPNRDRRITDTPVAPVP